ncbi:PREDICTED: uncharacterized protein LOC105365030 isoform X2 [Ceratosolen solmsi marchali]|nr:PREDICTED: uncharacterized protein LOC105365030 isoform X2 [Ceratosolen solmsi marchali]
MSRLTYVPIPEERLKLANMFIEVQHDVPPQHRVEETAGTRTLKNREREKIEKYVSLKSGTFSKEEDKLIKRNWKTFCKLYEWDPKNPKPFLQMKLKNKVFFLNLRNRKKFVQFLANGLFDRSLYSVYNRFKVMYDPHKVSRYSEYEDKIILNSLQNSKVTINNRKFADLALTLKRTRHSVWRRYRLLKKKYKLESVDHKS